MPKLISTMEGDRVVFHIEIEHQIKEQNWCVIVSSKSNYGGGYNVPTMAKILEYIYKVDTFCGTGSQIIKKDYPMPGQYLALLGIDSKEILGENIVDTIDRTRSETGPILTKFDISGYYISDKDVKSAKDILTCMADIHNEYKKKDEKVFDNMILEPMFSTIVEFLNYVANKRDIAPYVDVEKFLIRLQGPILREGKYFWPVIRDGKYVDYYIY
jgi:hypothetical protein